MSSCSVLLGKFYRKRLAVFKMAAIRVYCLNLDQNIPKTFSWKLLSFIL